jgi:NAD-dependent DNA ligase
MYDRYMQERIEQSINMTVPFYLMAAYAYYKEDDPIISDHSFDMLAKLMLENWSKIKHMHKRSIKKADLEAGTFLGKYKQLTIDSLHHLRKNIKKDEDSN